MDNALLGVIVGSVLSLVGNLLQHWFSGSKERRKWEQQRKAEEAAWLRSNIKEQSSSLREAYQNAIYSLSMLVMDDNPFRREESTPESMQLQTNRTHDAFNWVTQLSLRGPSPQFENQIYSFIFSPEDSAKSLRAYLLQLAKAETDVFQLQPLKIEEPPPTRVNHNSWEMHFHIDETYRRNRFVEGVELPKEKTIRCRLKMLSQTQRKLLLESANSSTSELVPYSLWLPMPRVDAYGNIDRAGNQWHAHIDSCAGHEPAILNAWEQDYNAALSKIIMPVKAAEQ